MANTVYDDEKQREKEFTPEDDARPGAHDDLGIHPERREAEAADLEKALHAPSAEEPDYSAKSSKELKKSEEAGGPSGPSPSYDDGFGPSMSLVGGEGLFKNIEKSSSRFRAVVTGNIFKGRRGRVTAGISAGLLGLGLVGFSFFSFLNVFKLDHMLKNIDAKTFSRFNAQFAGRSNTYVRSYIRLRMMQIGDKSAPDANGNLYFRAHKVDTGNPMQDWYATLKTSSFEKDLLEQDGISFTSVIDENGHIRPGQIKIKDEAIPFDVVAKYQVQLDQVVKSGNPALLASFTNQLGGDIDNFVQTKVFDSDKTARREIKTVVNDRTHFFQVIKRRRLRRNIQNMIGVRNWNFFETSIRKYQEKKTDVQKKIVEKLFPNQNALADLLKCIFVGTCNTNNDVAHEVATEVNIKDPSANSATVETTDKNGKPITTTVDTGGNQLVEDALKATEAETSQTAANTATNTESTTISQRIVRRIVAAFVGDESADAISSAIGNPAGWWRLAKKVAWLDTAMKNHTISKMIKKARLAQAVALSTTYIIARDQMKTGQVSAGEVNDMMKTVENFNDSEGWDMVAGQGAATASAATASSVTSPNPTKEEYCKAGHVKTKDEYAWYCNDQKPNSGGKSSTIEAVYQNSVGYIFGPVAKAVNGVRHIPIIGSLVEFASGIMNSVIGTLTSAVIQPILDQTGITDGLGSLLTFGMQKFMAFAGAGPIFDGSGPGIANLVTSGSAGTAENSTRLAGGVASTRQTLNYSNAQAANYLRDQKSSQSVYQRYASLDNSDSLAARSLFAVSNLSASKTFSYLGNMFSSVGSIFSNIFTGRIFAATSNDPASAISTWAGVDTYDIPQACQDLNPLDDAYMQKAVGVEGSSPYAGKANAVIGKIKAAINVKNLRDENAFWKIVYDKIGTRDDSEQIAGAIYNCALLDEQVQGGLGALYGYTNDGGLSSN